MKYFEYIFVHENISKYFLCKLQSFDILLNCEDIEVDNKRISGITELDCLDEATLPQSSFKIDSEYFTC
jgi:hypothetical protein